MTPDFPLLCSRVRLAIVRRLGANAAKDLLLLLDLIEVLGIDKQDRVVETKEKVDSLS